MDIKIAALIGINNCILAVYHSSYDQMYRFSIANESRKTYTCDSSFPTLSSAKFMGISITERLAIDRDRRS